MDQGSRPDARKRRPSCATPVISIENGPVLALWQPGSDTIPAPSGAAFRLAPGSKIHLQIHYKKHFDQEQNAVSDKSTVGLYFTDPPASGSGAAVFRDRFRRKARVIASGPAVLRGTLPKAARIVALRPMLDRAYESLNVDAITPSGDDVPLLRLHGPSRSGSSAIGCRNRWNSPAAARLRCTSRRWPDYSDEPKVTRQFPLQVVLDYVPL